MTCRTGPAQGRLPVLVLLAAVLPAPTGAHAAAPEPWFTEIAGPAGLDFVHFNGMTGAFHYPELWPEYPPASPEAVPNIGCQFALWIARTQARLAPGNAPPQMA